MFDDQAQVYTEPIDFEGLLIALKDLLTTQEQELVTKRNWGDNHLPQLKQELFQQGQTTFTELKESINKAWFTKGKSEVQNKLEQLNNFFTKRERERAKVKVDDSKKTYIIPSRRKDQ